jgi:hypothetical protein
MNKNLLLGGIVIVAVMIIVIINVDVPELRYNSKLTLANIEALTNETNTSDCVTNCEDGGCGKSTCSTGYTDILTGKYITISTTASSGYYACCYNDGTSHYYARSFKNSCCNK